MDNGLCCPTCGSEKMIHVIGGVYECNRCGKNVDQHELIPVEDYKA